MPPPKHELTEAGRITVNDGGSLAPTETPGGIGGTGATVLAQEAPAPPPEADLSFKKGSGGNNAISEMLISIMPDIEKGLTELKVNEGDAQEDCTAELDKSDDVKKVLGHFDIVITSVDKMLAELRQEEMDDITLRD